MYVGKRVKRFTIRTEKKGRPIRRWHEYIKEDMVAVGAAGTTGEDSQDRGKWRRLIRTGNPRES